jgi:hypothetical protein
MGAQAKKKLLAEHFSIVCLSAGTVILETWHSFWPENRSEMLHIVTCLLKTRVTEPEDICC